MTHSIFKCIRHIFSWDRHVPALEKRYGGFFAILCQIAYFVTGSRNRCLLTDKRCFYWQRTCLRESIMINKRFASNNFNLSTVMAMYLRPFFIFLNLLYGC